MINLEEKAQQSRFNRNILGCKAGRKINSTYNSFDLIETYWDVKLESSASSIT